ncbi:MAG: hypothetical protein K6357_04795 [Elusimicrobiota bacterium]
MKLKVFLCIILVFVNFSSAKNFMDFSYTTGDNDFNKYSFTYLFNFSTYVFSGFNYSAYDLKDVSIVSSVRFPVNILLKNALLSIKPFYYFKKDAFKAKGIRLGARYMKGDEEKEINTVYSGFIGYANMEYESKTLSITYADASIEKNFYDLFFFFIRGGVRLSKEVVKWPVCYLDNLDVLSYSYSGVLSDTIHSVIGLELARSFKPDFNSYVYIGANRINTYYSDVNSYSAGIKTYLDDKENYYMDFNYNYADFKKGKDIDFWKISTGINF